MEKDKRIEQVLAQILSFAKADFNARTSISEKGDELDAIIAGLNTMGEEMQGHTRTERTFYDTDRINRLLNILLKYTRFDFSEKAPISEKGDEVDAIAAGLNTLVEELNYYTKQLEHANRQLRLNEARTRLVTAEVRDYAIFTLSPVGIVTSWNKGAERINGYREEEIIGKHFSVFYTKEDRENKFPEYELEVAVKEGRFEDEGWRVRKDGSLFWANVIITALMIDGKLVGFSKITRDLTKRKELEDSLKRSNEQLTAVNKELESFTYSVSHDLRAPLRAVHGYAQMLKEDYENKLDKEATRMLDMMMQSSTQMGKLIDDLLEFSRLGRRDLNKVKINMKEAAEAAIKQLREYTQTKAEIIVHGMSDAQGDASLINQVFNNLISNAIKYSAKKDNPKIEIGETDTEKGKAYYVKDNGAGFNMKFYDKLFGVFQRLHRQEEFEGTGVGLAISHRIVTRHGGKIWAEGEPGKGATFYFTLTN